MKSKVADIVAENNEVTGKEVLAILKKRFPKEDFKEGSVQVAFSNVRAEMGIGKRRKLSRRATRKIQKRSEVSVSVEHLRMARDFVAAVGGDEKVAVEAVRQLQSLQV